MKRLVLEVDVDRRDASCWECPLAYLDDDGEIRCAALANEENPVSGGAPPNSCPLRTYEVVVCKKRES